MSGTIDTTLSQCFQERIFFSVSYTEVLTVSSVPARAFEQIEYNLRGMCKERTHPFSSKASSLLSVDLPEQRIGQDPQMEC